MLLLDPRVLRSGFLIALLSLSVACSGQGDDDDMAGVPCVEDSRSEAFSEDMEKTGAGELAVFTLHSIDPSPPDIGDNTWSLSVRDADDDSALSSCSLDVRPWMPDHEHGSNNPTGSESAPGTYTVSGLLFIMPGYWESTVSVDCQPGGDDDDSAADDSEAPPQALSDSATFGFCVEG
jgi:hypothetical protein